MQKIFFFLLITFSIGCSAQLTPHPPGSYITNSFLDKFVGTWVWVSGTDTMEIVLQKQKVHFYPPMDYDQDMLIGWHRYVKNGALIESSLLYTGSLFDSVHHSLFGSSEGKFRVRFTTFRDITKNKRSDNCYVDYVGGTPPQLNWTLKNSQGMKPGGFDYNFTVPTTMTLIKQ